ncbi:MAG: ABC transporter permease, partial [Planctomycetota bacterium]
PSVVVKEHLLYQLGLTNDADLNAAVGRKLRIEFRPTRNEGGITVDLIKADRAELTRDESALLAKIRARLPATVPSLGLTTSELLILKNALSNETSVLPEPIYREYTIAGVQRDGTPEEMEEANRRAFQWLNSDSPVTLPYQTAIDLMQKLFKGNTVGLEHAVVFVDSPQHSKDVVKAINDLGLNAYAPLEHIERERLMYLLIFGGMTCIAAIALLVAALGIANTMLMSVLERTREIGIMKSVGAGNGTLQFLFLVEGALIGLLGGGLGLLAAWGASFPGDAYIRSLVTNDLKINLDQSIFVFPPWLAMTVLTFAVLVTTLAAVSPARRAARIDPVRALRHE